MDSITQAVLGATMGEAVLGRKLGWRGAAWGALFGTLPDLDVFFIPWLNEVQRVYWHRGLSHSVLAMVVGALVFGYLLRKWWQWTDSIVVKRPRYYRRVAKRCRSLAWGGFFRRVQIVFWKWFREARGGEVSLRKAMLFVFLAWSTHVMIDCFTTYGTSLWEPFHHSREWWNLLFIIDPIFTAFLILGVFVSATFLRKSSRRGWGNAVGLGLAVLYVGFAGVLKVQAHAAFTLQLKGTGAQVIATSPTPFNSVLWRCLAETDQDYLIGYWSPFDDDGKIHFDVVPKNHELMSSFVKSQEFEALDWFSRGHWAATTGLERGSARLTDMRFGEMRVRDEDGQLMMMPMFNWELEKGESGVSFQAYRPDRSKLDMEEMFDSVWRRMWGDETDW